ncbi:MAG: VOC family protein [Planctomycetaceae bacterium]
MTTFPAVGDIYPTLTYNDPRAAIDWLCRAFGFTTRLIVDGPNDTVMHSELSLGSGVIMVSSPKPETGHVSPRGLPGVSQGLCIRIDDPDAHYEQAKAAGAVITRELQDEDYGSRGYMATDPEGHVWYFGTYRPGAWWDGKTPEGGG